MQAINSNLPSAFASTKVQLSFRSDQHRAEKSESKHHQHHHQRTEHGGKRGMRVFRQEMLLALKMKFQQSFSLRTAATNPYRNSESAEDVATEILTVARGAAQDSALTPADTLGQIRDTLQKATGIAGNMAGSDEDVQGIKDTEKRILSGLDAIEKQATTTASRFSLEASIKQRSTIQIRTQEGDIVKFELRQIERLSASDTAFANDSGSGSLTEVAVSSRSQFVLKVDGDLNEAELTAITNVFAQAEKLAAEFFDGDLNAAFEIASALEFDSEQLARVSMKFRSQQSISATRSVLESAPPISVMEEPVANTGGSIGPGNAVPVISDEVDAMPADVAAKDAPVAKADSTAGFGSLLGYLKSVADYLEDSVAKFVEASRPDTSHTKIRFEITESLRLSILRTVMTEIAPDKAESESTEHGDTIKQLAENREES